MKRTLIITMEFPPQIGGIATYIHDLANALDPASTIVVAPLDPNAKAWDQSQKYKIIRMKMLSSKLLWPRWLPLIFKIRKLVKREKIEVIMIHHVLPIGYVGVIIKKLKKIPFLLFSHGTDLLAGTATPWKKRMVAMVSRNSAQIIFNSESLKRRFLHALPQFEKSSRVLYPCPEEDFLIPPPVAQLQKMRQQYALEGKRVILSISRLDEGKGFPHLIRIMPDVLKKFSDLVWIIVGDGPKREYITGLIQKNYLQNVVRYVGVMPHDVIKPFYYLADVFVLFTHPDEGREEGLGLVFLEASAAGIPALAGRSGGVEEAVLNGQTGIVVDITQNVQGAKDALMNLLENKTYAQELGNNGQARIRAEFSWPHQLEQLGTWLT